VEEGQALKTLKTLQHRIDSATVEDAEASWECGKVLSKVKGNRGRLPNGFLARLVEATEVSARTWQYRIRFYEAFPKKKEMRNALRTRSSWRELIREDLTDSPSSEESEEEDGRPWWQKGEVMTVEDAAQELVLTGQSAARQFYGLVDDLTAASREEFRPGVEEVAGLWRTAALALKHGADNLKKVVLVRKVEDDTAPADVTFDELLEGGKTG
jgi:hypothetical protein